MKRKDKANIIGETLEELYPTTPIPLDHSSAYTLLVAVMLSAQTTDKKVNEVTPVLFRAHFKGRAFDVAAPVHERMRQSNDRRRPVAYTRHELLFNPSHSCRFSEISDI